MPYTPRFFLLAGVFMAEAIWLRDRPLLAIIFLMAGITFFTVALAYAGLGSRVFHKKADGKLGPTAWFTLGPYLALTHFSFLIHRFTSRRPPFSTITPKIILGRLPTQTEAARLCNEGVAAVLDLTCEFSESAPLRTRVAYFSVPVLDGTAPTLAQLDAATAFIHEKSQLGPVFVHCALGHGRSATVVLAYLLSSGRAATIDEALAMLTAARPGVSPNAAQLRRLAEFHAARSASR
jgi:protein-tyrosine phosphatase